MDKINFHLIIGGLLLFLTAGCLSISEDADNYASDYLNNFDYLSASAPEELCKEGYCKCFVCKNGTALFYITTSLAGGNCYFHNECTAEVYEEFRDPTKESEYTMRYFMLGAGPSFADFGEANRYCHYGLTMAVQWLLGDENKEYDLPDGSRAICMLQEGVMPVYVLYTDSENIDITRTAEIVREFADVTDITMGHLSGPAGPVVITTEFEYNTSKPGVVDAVVDQIRVINQECNNLAASPPEINCFVAVAPKMGDTEALDAVMSRVGKNEVHLLAYGINSHYDETGACRGSRMTEEAVKFSRYGLYTYSLPSIIPYVLFDANTKSADGRCTWYDGGYPNAVEEGYSRFFPDGIQMLAGAGVIGIAPYDFNSSSFGADPLHCSDCALGAKESRLISWFGGCQDMIKISEEQPSGRIPIIFPNESGGYCDFGVQSDEVFKIFQSKQGQEITTTTTHTFEEPDPDKGALFRCDACLTQTDKSVYEYFPILENDKFQPHGVEEVLANLYPEITGEPRKCYVHPEIDYYASRFSVDPLLLRAIAWSESSFNHCKTEKLCKGTYHPPEDAPPELKCTEDAGYSVGYNEMYDPSGECQTKEPTSIDAYMEASGVFTSTDDDPEPLFRFAGLGLFQVIESPYTFWPEEYNPEDVESREHYIELFEFARARGRTENVDSAKECSEEFNPYNSSHNTCLGAKKLQGALRNGRSWADETNNKWPSRCPDLFEIGTDTSKRDLLAAFWAIYRLTGAPEGYDPYCPSLRPVDCWAKEYCDIKAISDECVRLESTGDCITGCVESFGECVPDPDIYVCGGDYSRDFLSFSNCLITEHGIEERPIIYAGFNKLAAYQNLREECEETNFCPPWSKILRETGIDIDDETRVNPVFAENTDDPYAIFDEGG